MLGARRKDFSHRSMSYFNKSFNREDENDYVVDYNEQFHDLNRKTNEKKIMFQKRNQSCINVGIPFNEEGTMVDYNYHLNAVQMYHKKNEPDETCVSDCSSVDNRSKGKHFRSDQHINKNVKIRKHLYAQNNDFQFLPSETNNFHENQNVRNSFCVKPITMNDAYSIRKSISVQNNKIHSFSIQQNVNGSSRNETFIIGRHCWSKLCFSDSKHSHVVFQKFQNSFLENREAILDTLPLHGSKERSCWSKFLDVSSCIKRVFSTLELWNDSLKRIEGLQGTGVVSYFVFLRWLIALNLILFILYFLLVTLPHAAFPKLSLREITTAPNETVINEEFLNKFPSSPRDLSLKPKEPKNVSQGWNTNDLFSNWGDLLKNLPDNILDVTLSYNKRNYTTHERRNFSQYCEARYMAEMENNTIGILSAIQDLLQGTGWLQSTILFLGHYPAHELSYFGLGYNMSVAVIVVLFTSFVICVCMMIRYSSQGVQETILARKNDYLAYSNILFCSWDYCIEDRKSSIIRHNSILHEMKSTLAEERRKREIKQWSKSKKIKVYFLRTIINLFVISILCGSYYFIYRVVTYQLKELQLHRLNKPGVNIFFVQYLSPIVITGLNIFVPIIFNNIVKFEMYNTQTQINMALFRTVFLRLSSVFVLVGLLYQQITCEPRDMCGAGISATCLSPICWETYVGQQLYKLAVTDFFVYIVMFTVYDLPRDIIVRRFKNKVTQLVGRQVFDLPNQVLSLVYSQTLCWLGVVYSPLLPAITVIKFIVVFQIKKLMVLRYCVPAPIPYKASRSNAMFMIILMLSFFTLMIIHGYSLSSVEPSPACSPFRHYYVMIEAISDAVFTRSSSFASFINFLFSALFLIPAIILLCIAIYYYWTIVVAHRKMVKVLKAQIALEGRDKQFLLNRLTEVARGQFYK
ncbi:transmembrane channel-like protein 7 [Trichonephila inaurata madagascariensis]|uniref:Transmembrane channel-like protein 7 n=1 Tax=Trichonephila inaurata madagascariensis TaxID=2747483 RepID=A0A8X6Y3M3_9ARAC|nr:transmembrane channel-like protein 7 [Trichonephila inaurata madagascariensis]